MPFAISPRSHCMGWVNVSPSDFRYLSGQSRTSSAAASAVFSSAFSTWESSHRVTAVFPAVFPVIRV